MDPDGFYRLLPTTCLEFLASGQAPTVPHAAVHLLPTLLGGHEEELRRQQDNKKVIESEMITCRVKKSGEFRIVEDLATSSRVF